MHPNEFSLRLLGERQMGSICDAHPLRGQAFGSLLCSLQIESRPGAELLQQEHKLTALFTIGGRFDLSIMRWRNDQRDLFLSDEGKINSTLVVSNRIRAWR